MISVPPSFHLNKTQKCASRSLQPPALPQNTFSTTLNLWPSSWPPSPSKSTHYTSVYSTPSLLFATIFDMAFLPSRPSYSNSHISSSTRTKSFLRLLVQPTTPPSTHPFQPLTSFNNSTYPPLLQHDNGVIQKISRHIW